MVVQSNEMESLEGLGAAFATWWAGMAMLEAWALASSDAGRGASARLIGAVYLPVVSLCSVIVYIIGV